MAAVDLKALRRPFVLREDRLDPAAPALLYRDPVDIVRADDPAEIDTALRRLDAGRRRGFHAAGFLSFELGYAFEPHLAPLLPAGRGVPLLWFGLFVAPQVIAPPDLDAAFAALGPPPPVAMLAPGFSRSTYTAKARALLEHIAAGDVYQVNLTFALPFRYEGSPLALYGALRSRQIVAHGGIVAFDDAAILSVSPELFLEVRDGIATTRPMKGTVPRGRDAATDADARATLAADPKQRAENLMIVDLMRNDLARVSEPGSVAVPQLFTVETYPTLHTMTSTVTARLRPGLALPEIVAALFPCGSITGAPKHRAIELIRAFETTPRGVYTGAIGTIAPDGGSRFNVAIRTALLRADGSGRYGIGAGLVADSDPDREYDECLLKARVLTDLAADYGLIETLRWSRETSYGRLALHLERLQSSARTLGFAFDRGAAENELDRLATTLTNGAHRIRLELRRDGSLSITAAPLTDEPARALRVALSGDIMDAGDPFLRFKTTQRQRYDTAFHEASTRGFDEIIFRNRQGFVTEASRNNIFVERDGTLVTPPLAHGVLPGILRRSLIESGAAIEASLTLAYLRTASRWFLGNSLRGLREAVLCE